MIRPRLTHVALFVADVDRSVSFYREFARLHVVHERIDGGVHVAWLSEQEHDPEFVIVVIGQRPGRDGEPPHLAHFGFAVENREAVDAVAAHAGAAKCLAEPPRDAGSVVGYFCLLRDPDGNLVEFSFGQSINPRDLEPARAVGRDRDS